MPTFHIVKTHTHTHTHAHKHTASVHLPHTDERKRERDGVIYSCLRYQKAYKSANTVHIRCAHLDSA